MLHEFGHAVYFGGVDARTAVVDARHAHVPHRRRRDAVRSPRARPRRGFAHVAGLPDGTVDDLAPRLAAAQPRASAALRPVGARHDATSSAASTRNPDGRHDSRWWDLVERFQLVRRPDGRHAPDWAAKIHISAAPVYYHNYLFGELVASQLAATLGGLVDNPSAPGAMLGTRLFAPGTTDRWDRLIEHATGRALTPAVLASRTRELKVRGDVRHALRAQRRHGAVREELRPPSRRGPGRRVAPAARRGRGVADAVPRRSPTRARSAFVGSRPDVAVGRRARRQRARCRDRQREDLDGRHIRRSGPPPCSAWTSCGSVSSEPASADDAVDVITTLLERYGQGGSGEPHADEPYFSSFLLVDPDAGLDRRDQQPHVGRAARRRRARRSRIASASATDWTRASADVAPGTDFDRYRATRRCPPARADHRLAVTRAAVARGDRARRPTDSRDAAQSRSRPRHRSLPADDGADGEGYTVCMHRPEVHAQTTASMIARPPPGRADAHLDRARQSVHERVRPRLPARARARARRPPRMAAVRASCATASSAANPTSSPGARRRSTAVEAELWAAADAAYRSGERRARRLRGDGYAPVDAALHRLGV